VKQAAVADRLVITKSDLVDTPERQAARQQLLARLRALNPAAPILDAAAGEAVPAALFNCGLYDPARKIPDVGRWLADETVAAAQEAHHHHDHGQHDHGHHHHDVNRHDARVRAFTLASADPISTATFDLFLELLKSMHGPNLLRVKGIVNIEEMPERPVVIHGVQHVFHPPAQLEGWPNADRRTRLVFIVRDIEPRVISELFDAFLGQLAPDRPDRAALTDNPLVPFGGRDR
jgi:G3E family GTPase